MKAICQPTSTLLHGIPGEIRDQIWYQAMTLDDDITIETTTLKDGEIESYKMAKPPLLDTCKQIQEEAANVYYPKSIFRAIVTDACWQTPIVWLESLPKEERKAIGRLVIQYEIDEVKERLDMAERYTAPSRAVRTLAALTSVSPGNEIVQHGTSSSRDSDLCPTSIFRFSGWMRGTPIRQVS